MPDDKETDRLRRNKRRNQQDREKGSRRAEKARAAHLESKATDEKSKLNERISKLIEQGYSPASVAKRFGFSVSRINTALKATGRS
jgi:Skp family chaperone for outer membrane proteins